MKITATQSRFIKLGHGGGWEEECIEGASPCIKLGFCSNQHHECLAGNWESVLNYYLKTDGRTKGKATEFTNQVKAFYTADEKTLWITFYKRKLYWCFASKVVEELPDKNRIRRTIGSWSCQDLTGKELHVDSLSGTLTKVQGFRGTICAVDQHEYLLKRLNGELPVEVAHATECLQQLEAAMQPLIQKLGWKDFELLCDLIFTQAGWQRISSLGKTEKTVDMDLQSPVTGRRAWVQVKSRATLDTFHEYKKKFEAMPGYDEMYFVVHTPSPDLAAHDHAANSSIILLTADRLAKLIVSAGLSQWLIQKTS